MNLTLYANSILTPEYREVFDTKRKYQQFENGPIRTAFEHYLDSLWSTTFQIQNRYLSDKETFNLPIGFQDQHAGQNDYFSFSPYMYNYMSVYSQFSNIAPSYGETGEHNYYKIIKRYYFIEHIEIRNNLAVITCTIDYWHTYRFALGGLNFGKYTPESLRNQFVFSTKYGFLTSSKIVDYSPTNFKLQYYKPPMEYTGNNGIKLTELYNYGTDKGCYLIVTLSRYKTEQSGVYSERKVDNYIIYLSDTKDDNNIFSNIETVFSLDNRDTTNIVNVLNDLMLLSSDPTGVLKDKNNTGTFKYYSIISAYAIPSKMACIDGDYILDDIVTSKQYYDNYIENNGKYIIFFNLNKFTDIGKPLNIYKKVVVNDFKNYGIGLFTQLIELKSNGNPINVEVKIVSTTYQFSAFLNIQNTLYDITDDLEIKLPINVEDASTMALDKIKRELSTFSLQNELKQARVQLGRNEVNSMANVINGIGSLIMSGGVMGSGSIISGVAGTAFSRQEYGLKKSLIDEKIKTVNAEVYASNKGIITNSNGGINAYFGLVLASIDADNETEVTNAINALGYTCAELVDAQQILDLDDTVASREKFNVVKFSDVTVYGTFPQDVARVFESILKAGVKIWYEI